MGRYDVHVGVEGEYEPGSHGRVLRNLIGIKSKREIDQAETESLFKTQRRYFSLVTRDAVLSTDLILRMHGDWLGEIYVWAGRFRTVEVSKCRSVERRFHLAAGAIDFTKHAGV